jgi:hypothetical protein
MAFRLLQAKEVPRPHRPGHRVWRLDLLGQAGPEWRGRCRTRTLRRWRRTHQWAGCWPVERGLAPPPACVALLDLLRARHPPLGREGLGGGVGGRGLGQRQGQLPLRQGECAHGLPQGHALDREGQGQVQGVHSCARVYDCAQYLS